MLVAATHLYHLPVLDPDTHARLGTVERLIFDVEKGKLAALAIQSSGLIKRIFYVASLDIISFENHALLCDEQSLTALNELPRIQQLIAARTPLLGQSAETTTKKSLGRVKEVLFDDCSYLIIQIHTRHLFDSRVFDRTAVQKVTRRAVILADDDAHETDKLPLAETARA